MKLVVRVIGARKLPAMDLNGLSNPYVRLKLGKQKFRSKVVKKNLNPQWEEEFSFQVDDLKDQLVISVMDEDKYFNDDFMGRLKLPVSLIFDSESKSLGTAWYSLRPKKKKSKNKDCGQIHLSIHFLEKKSVREMKSNGDQVSDLRKQADVTFESPSRSIDFLEQPEIAKLEVDENNPEDQSSSYSFEEAMRKIETRDEGSENPSNLPGGVLLDQLYIIAPPDLNTLLFSPDSSFPKSLADLQGTTELQVGPWKFENDGDILKRSLTYIKAATKLLKAVKGFEDQKYVKADGKNFAILATVSTPDVMYGSTFRTELLFCISPGPELPSGDQSSYLVISWRMNFVQSTMMKGMIENGARLGLKESFNEYASFLSQNVKPVDSKDLGSSKEQVLVSLRPTQSDWKLGLQYFANFHVVSTVFLGLYVAFHILFAAPSTIQGLEFVGLDLPDSVGEFIVCGVLVLQGERLFELISRFLQARVQKGSDHGIKAQGEGWLLTVALIEGSNLAVVDSAGFSDPYVVLTCNGKTRTSSIKFQKSDPQWNEIFEFVAMDEPPSVLDVEVYDFDGPFDEVTSLGHAEINFLKTNISNLTDIWVPLEGKLALACQSKLHLRIFLENTRGSNVVKEYLSKMEKEVGKKISLRSPQTNSAFQKLFGLPPEEFLINDFTCHLKRKMPLQGRLFLSARIIGFHANLFGRKTKFFFVWEDVDHIQVVHPTLSSMGSPIIVITLRQGRGLDARHGAKTQDEEGRLKFHFQSFVSFNVAQRTIMALWKAKSLSPEQKVQIVEESGAKCLVTEESGSFLGLDDVSMSEIYSSSLSVPTSFFMELFSGGDVDRRVMEKAGYIDYSNTPWVTENGEVFERQVYYRFDRLISLYRGEVTSTQQRSPLLDRNGWLVEEVMALHRVPLGDYFNLHLQYQIEDIPSKAKQCKLKVFFGIEWLKNTRHQKRITKNILKNLLDRLKVILSAVEKEYVIR
ncbi:C2 and GRAM domain-containing protein [Quillaja saponaria]|uniref:C2 and GRAM domain-containing protein n=1 Tax=Quillaja saponaria TaxID=32244 RepID=A0AAD7KWZ9_QUISA|nr:C2 and GRAM domain-containing protein [Quillaja saponaria]